MALGKDVMRLATRVHMPQAGATNSQREAAAKAAAAFKKKSGSAGKASIAGASKMASAFKKKAGKAGDKLAIKVKGVNKHGKERDSQEEGELIGAKESYDNEEEDDEDDSSELGFADDQSDGEGATNVTQCLVQSLSQKQQRPHSTTREMHPLCTDELYPAPSHSGSESDMWKASGSESDTMTPHPSTTPFIMEMSCPASGSESGQESARGFTSASPVHTKIDAIGAPLISTTRAADASAPTRSIDDQKPKAKPKPKAKRNQKLDHKGAAKASSEKSKAQMLEEISWDAKQHGHVNPLQCSSIWEIPTSRDPNPIPAPRRIDPMPFEPNESTLPAINVFAYDPGTRRRADSREAAQRRRIAIMACILFALAATGAATLTIMLQD